MVSHLRDGYLNRSSTENFEAFSDYFYLICSTRLAYSICSIFILGASTLLTLAIHSSFLRAYSGVRVVTSTMGVSTMSSMKEIRMIPSGMRKK